jgi:hypothetical protein
MGALHDGRNSASQLIKDAADVEVEASGFGYRIRKLGQPGAQQLLDVSVIEAVEDFEIHFLLVINGISQLWRFHPGDDIIGGRMDDGDFGT